MLDSALGSTGLDTCPIVVESLPQLCHWTHRGVENTGRVRFLCSSLPMTFLWNMLSTEGKRNQIYAALPLAEVHLRCIIPGFGEVYLVGHPNLVH